MKNYILTGCDSHDKSMLLKIAHNDGAPQMRSFGSDREGRQKMTEHLKRCAKEVGGAEIVFGYEASGQGFGLYDDLKEAGIRCLVLAPTNLPRSPKSERDKTDEKDAQRVLDEIRAHVLAGKELSSVWVPDPQTRDDREVVRSRLDAAEKLSAIRIQIQSLLKRNDLRRPRGVSAPWTKPFRAWLLGLSKAPSALEAGARTALSSLLRQVEFLEEEVERLDQEVDRLSQTQRYREPVLELRKLKGVGVLTAMVFLTEMGDMARFCNRRQIGAYLGLAPTTYESGEAQDRKGHITHFGPWRVRRVLCQAFWCRMRTDAKEKAWFERWAQKHPKRKKVGVVAGMRRLGVRMWHRAFEAQQRQPHLFPPSVPPKGGDASLRPPQGAEAEALAGAPPD